MGGQMRDAGRRPNPNPGPLAGVRVLDLSRILAGPWTGQILADLGAEVIKVERPGKGDDTRGWGPPFLRGPDGTETTESAYYLGVNRAKRSITIDIKHPAGQRIIRELAKTSDVVLENYKIGTLGKLELDYEHLSAINRRLVYCSITGYGQTGPRSPEAAYDFAVQALGGLMSVTGERDDLPGGGPQKIGVPIVDLATGMYAAIAVLAALNRRDVTGTGDYIDLAMLDVQVSLLANQAMNYLVSGEVPGRSGNSHPNIQPQDVYQCSNGSIAVAVGNDAQFAAFCYALEMPGLAADERFTRNRDRVRNLAELRPALAARLATRTRQEWAERLAAAGIPGAPINSIDEVFAEPQVQHRGMTVTVPHPLAGSVTLVASPLRFQNSPVESSRAAPLLGEHTDQILQQIGLTDDQIRDLRADSVI
jgi:crotonobetainyl-CoA:carnitine CoA-transferase CaiB-like acyl-CoA transferase